MRKPRLTNVLFAVVVTIGVGGLVAGYVAFGAYAASQQHRADDLVSTVQAKNAAIAKKDAQLADLLDKYEALAKDCADAGCTTTAPSPEIIQEFIEGTPGQPGRAPTTSEIIQAIEEYCSARNDCSGADGTSGADGAAGASGPQGDQGPAGPAGADGRGITAVTCVMEPDLSTAFRFTFTDNTTEDVSAACIPN